MLPTHDCFESYRSPAPSGSVPPFILMMSAVLSHPPGKMRLLWDRKRCTVGNRASCGLCCLALNNHETKPSWDIMLMSRGKQQTLARQWVSQSVSQHKDNMEPQYVSSLLGWLLAIVQAKSRDLNLVWHITNNEKQASSMMAACCRRKQGEPNLIMIDKWINWTTTTVEP